MYGDRHNDRHNDRLSKLINQVCRAWEEEAAESDAKFRASINAVASDNELDRFNMHKAFKNAIASKNAEIFELVNECKRMKYLISQYGAENRELHKKLENAHRTIESLRGGGDDVSEHSSHSVSRTSKPFNPDAAIFRDGNVIPAELNGGAPFSSKSLPTSSGWEAHSYALHTSLDPAIDPSVGERGGSMADFGGLFSPSPSLSPFSPPSPGEAKPTAGTVTQQKFPTGSTSTTCGGGLMLGGGRFVVDGDREGPVFPVEEPDMGPPPGFQSASSPPAPPARATSRLAGVDTGSVGGEDLRQVDSSGPGASPLSSPSGSHTAM